MSKEIEKMTAIYFGKCKSRQHGNGFAAEMCG